MFLVDVARETAAVGGVNPARRLAELLSVIRLELPIRAARAEAEGTRKDHQETLSH